MNLLIDIAHPKWIVIQLEERCNLRCRMCYEWGEKGSYFGKEKLVSLDYSVIEKAVKALLPGKPFFGLFGGEPLLYPLTFPNGAIALVDCSFERPFAANHSNS